MRSFLFVILSCIVLAGGFFVYSRSQKTHVVGKDEQYKTEVPPPPLKPAARAGLGEGNGVWWEDFNEKGLLKNRFRAAQYIPQENGKVLVTRPQAEFYMPNSRMMRVTGDIGEVVMPASPPQAQGGFGSSIGGAPTRGQIHHVIIEIFNLFPDARPGVSDETIHTNNIQFDNDTMLITTELYRKDDGTTVDADRVKVEMRSDSPTRGYDLDGTGLRLRWNDKDGRLELLEIAHGEQLVVKDRSAVSGTLGGTDDKKHRPAVNAAISSDSAAPPMLAATDKASVAQAVRQASSKPSAAPGPRAADTGQSAVPIPYIVTFQDNVRITQGSEVLVTSDRMDIDFTTRKDTPSPTTAASAAKPDGGKARSPATTAATPPDNHDVVSMTLPASQPAKQAVTRPTTQPSEPVIIRWTGMLRMLPAKPDRPRVIAGDAIVELNGNPVMVQRTPAGSPEGDDIRAARLIYHTHDGSVRLVNSVAAPQVVISKLLNGKIDPRTTVTTSTLDYATDNAGRKFATLTGPGHAAVPVESTSARQGDSAKAGEQRMDARWKEGAKVFFIGKGQDDLAVEHVDLAGDVDVKHPQLVMQSQALSLFFLPAPPATRPSTSAATHPASRPSQPREGTQELRRVVATRAVHCELAGQNAKKQTIDCQTLEMRTGRSPDGKFYARDIDAQGAVHAFDSDQDLRAGIVQLTLKPAQSVAKPPATQQSEQPHTGIARSTTLPAVAAVSTQPAAGETDTASVELETMHARNDVRVVNKDGSIANGAALDITTEGNEPHVRLTGLPLATVIDAKKNIVSGPVITVEPKEGVAHVIGAGTMHVLQEQADGAKARPMDIAWADHADMNGPANRIDVMGEVVVNSLDADGAVNTSTGEHVRIDLVKKPATTRPATTQPASRPLVTVSSQPATPAARKDTMADSMQMDVMKDKDVRTITIEGDARVKSTLATANGTILRQFELLAPKIIYQLADTAELPAKSLLVPSAGQMLVRDHRPSQKTGPAKKGNAREEDESGSRGDTAFQWKKQLIYGEQARRAVMTGDVLIVHQAEGKEGADGPVRINSDEVIAWFEPRKIAEAPATRPAVPQPATQPAIILGATKPSATRPATQAARTRAPEPGTAMQLKRLEANGHAIVTRGGATLSADHIDFDPLSHWMNAYGSAARPAHYEDPDPHKSLTAQTISAQTQTWNFKASNPQSANPR